jgi:hypothetical protein
MAKKSKPPAKPKAKKPPPAPMMRPGEVQPQLFFPGQALGPATMPPRAKKGRG